MTISKFWFWVNIWLLVIIHTADMYLTQQYIGNNWQLENFPPMSYCIKEFGIINAVWIGRISFYYALMLAILFEHRKEVRAFVLCANLFYWTSMIIWIFFFGILKWPVV